MNVYWLVTTTPLLFRLKSKCQVNSANKSKLTFSILPFIRVSLIIITMAIGWSCSGQDQPNIILIVVDDMRFDEFGAGGHTYMETPNIDRLAKEGFMFKDAYHAVPLCSPNRASILTGQYPSRHGILDNTSRNQASHMIDLFPKDLQKVGYRTAHVGKWHMGNSSEPRPGYDYWVSFEGQGKTYNPDLYEEGRTHRVEGYITDIFTDRAVKFINESSSSDEPFFVYIGHKAIHPEAVQRDDGTVDTSVPMDFIPAKRHKGKYSDKTFKRSASVPSDPVADENKPMIKQAFEIRAETIKKDPKWMNIIDLGIAESTIQRRAEMMQAVDEGVGNIVDALRQAGELENTVIIFTSDNGYFYGEHGFSIERRMPYQESIKTPLIISSPRFSNAGREIAGLTLSIDLAATILDLASGKIPSTIQGKSLLPMIEKPGTQIRETAYIEYYSHENPMTWTANMDYRVIIKGKYKYIKWIRYEDQAELYDLEADPLEMDNLIDDQSLVKVIEDLKSELREGQLTALGLSE